MKAIVVIPLTVLVMGLCVSAAWDEDKRKFILKIHNDRRKAVPGACGMKMMRYDRQLEAESKAWAQKCRFEHQKKTRGENLAWYTKFGDENALIKKMADMWYNEVNDFDYNAYTCGAACHYTQMIWSNTVKVGCYAHHCPRLAKGGRNAYYLVCFYTPQGNIYGQKPYKKQCDAKTKGSKAVKPAANNNNNNAANNNNNNNNNNAANNNNNNNNNTWQSGGQPDWNSVFPDSDIDWSQVGSNNGGQTSWTSFGPNGQKTTYRVVYRRYR